MKYVHRRFSDSNEALFICRFSRSTSHKSRSFEEREREFAVFRKCCSRELVLVECMFPKQMHFLLYISCKDVCNISSCIFHSLHSLLTLFPATVASTIFFARLVVQVAHFVSLKCLAITSAAITKSEIGSDK